jgi:peptidoglycan-N-acetylglucosamine deacetylase
VDRRAFLGRTGLLAGGLVAGAGFREVGPAAAAQDLTQAEHIGMAAVKEPDVRLGSSAVTWRVHTDAKLIALTFDDGPMPRWTPMALDICADRKIRATFNLVGSRLVEHPDIARRMVAEGHEVGNHTWGHRDLASLDHTAAYDEISRSHEAIRRLTGQTATHLRPPFGHLGGAALLAAGQLGYDVVLWSLQLREQVYGPAAQVAHAVEGTVPGTILLAHDVGKADRLKGLRALPDIIDGVRAKGFSFVTVSELMAAATPVGAPRVPPQGAAVSATPVRAG